MIHTIATWPEKLFHRDNLKISVQNLDHMGKTDLEIQSQVPIPHCSVLEVYKSNETDISWEDDIRRDLGGTY